MRTIWPTLDSLMQAIHVLTYIFSHKNEHDTLSFEFLNYAFFYNHFIFFLSKGGEESQEGEPGAYSILEAKQSVSTSLQK